MIQKMIATQPAGDEFWDERAQAFFAEEEGDKGFDVALDPDAHYVDKVDSDFDEDESSAASESEAEEEKGPKAKSSYVDPRNRGGAKKKKQKTEPAAAAAAPPPEAAPVAPSVVGVTGAPEKREKRVYRKKQVASSDRVVRTSTSKATEVANFSEKMFRKTRRKNAKRVVRVPTQAEILREADKTERQNIASLHAIRKWEEAEKLRRKPKGPVLTGPRVVYHSKGEKTFVTFRDCDGCGVLSGCLRALEGRTDANAPAFPKPPEPGPVAAAAMAACDVAAPPVPPPMTSQKKAARPAVPVPPPPLRRVVAPPPLPPVPVPVAAVVAESPAAGVFPPVVEPERKRRASPRPPQVTLLAPVMQSVAQRAVPELPDPPPTPVAASHVPKKKTSAPKKRDRELLPPVPVTPATPASQPPSGAGLSRSGRAIKKSKHMDDFAE